MRFIIIITTVLLLCVSATACSFFGSDDADDAPAFCAGRHNVIVEASQQTCNEAGSDVAEWIDGQGCYCY